MSEGTDSTMAMVNDLVANAEQAERSKVILFLAERMERIVSHTMDWPLWRRIIWGYFHPCKFNRAVALADAVKAIHAGGHLSNHSAQEG